jgi:hypothetical protein
LLEVEAAVPLQTGVEVEALEGIVLLYLENLLVVVQALKQH